LVTSRIQTCVVAGDLGAQQKALENLIQENAAGDAKVHKREPSGRASKRLSIATSSRFCCVLSLFGRSLKSTRFPMNSMPLVRRRHARVRFRKPPPNHSIQLGVTDNPHTAISASQIKTEFEQLQVRSTPIAMLCELKSVFCPSQDATKQKLKSAFLFQR
jgi:hypothetical protein